MRTLTLATLTIEEVKEIGEVLDLSLNGLEADDWAECFRLRGLLNRGYVFDRDKCETVVLDLIKIRNLLSPLMDPLTWGEQLKTRADDWRAVIRRLEALIHSFRAARAEIDRIREDWEGWA